MALAAFAICQANAQNDPKEVAFIKEATGLKRKIIYSDGVSSYAIRQIKENLKADTLIPQILILTKEDRAQIAFCLEKMSNPIWVEGLFKRSKLIKRDTIDAIFKDKARSWDYFYKTYGRYFDSFSKPIFLRDSTFCIFYRRYSGGDEGGSDDLSIYQKTKGKWKKVKKLYWSMS